jgi:single-stranded-DNA-specific exonuclease
MIAAVSLAEELGLPPSLLQVLQTRGFTTLEQARHLLEPALATLGSPDHYPDMPLAVRRLRAAIEAEEPIAIYADRDVDGISGLVILARTLRTLGGNVVWANPLQGRGVQRPVLETLLQQKPRVLVFVDCGTGEETEINWLADQGIDVIVADHHRLSAVRPRALAWIHPGAAAATIEAPAGCVMAFKLAQALLLSFLGNDDPARLDYFLFDHLDLLCLGILADRVAVTGENRTYVWHGLRRLAATRKGGVGSLMRFFRLMPRSGPVSVREATWQIIPLLNAAGRLGQPQWAIDLLMTEESWVAQSCIDQLLQLNRDRRTAQQRSLEIFEKAVIEQCAIETDPVLVAMAEGLEPSVTGLAAQSLARKYGRPVFLFVQRNAEEAVGSARGNDDVDLFAWAEAQKELIVKFGGHQGAVGLTIRLADFALLRERLIAATERLPLAAAGNDNVSTTPEADIALHEATASWWDQLQRLEPFGPGFPCPVFRVTGIESLRSFSRARTVSSQEAAQRRPVVRLESAGMSAVGELEACAKFDLDDGGPGPWTLVAHPVAARKSDGFLFKWIIQEVRKENA